MQNFTYYNPVKIIFGKDSHKELSHELKNYRVSSLLLVYSGNFIKNLGIWNTVVATCKDLHIDLYECGDIVPNPEVQLVRRLIDMGRGKEIDFILAVGGGSSIDTAKAIACGIPYDGDVWDFFEGKSSISSALPLGVITTLPASGSEASNCSIISNGLYKKGIETEHIIPRFAIMNPEFTLCLPWYQTSCGIADILAHLLERYFTHVKNVDTTDFLIEGAIKALIINAERVMENPSDYHARAEIQWLASIAHNNLLDTGRIACWGTHRIEHELSAQYGITHGEGMAVVFIAWIKHMALRKPVKLAQLANRVFHCDYHDYSEEKAAMYLSKELTCFFKSLQLKITLSELAIDSTDFEEIALRATHNDTEPVGHYIPLYSKDIVDILTLAL